ncbi:nucleophile aminohydrolase [Echria macrotheca]|uniref:Nucleophile aminohydrolase n=1 Tax=Echria macrotheca TaxID=438768 RepID=A0AAJ0BNB3_9PEZI|nr:nucleophile aminohydrolase [Echria macrotheca]
MTPSPGPTEMGGDGAADKTWKRGNSPGAVFIHAGAGYHSLANEKVHLEVCAEAARAAMKYIRYGAPATEAVEAAIKYLENKEITNCGYGSNLNIDGTVECDATIVDHLGRSGACGAVPGVRNPIALAKKILDKSSQPLSLRRVPPNILVGTGARQFAEEHRLSVLSNDHLVSKNARDRYLRWNKDLKKAEARYPATPNPASKQPEEGSRSPTPGDYDRAADPRCETRHGDHTAAILTGIWNEGQPDSPGPGSSPAAELADPILTVTSVTSSPSSSPRSTGRPSDRSNLNLVRTAFQSRPNTSSKRPKLSNNPSDDSAQTQYAESPNTFGVTASPHDSSVSEDEELADVNNYQDEYGYDSTHDGPPSTLAGTKRPASSSSDDAVTDTVGAIVIDMYGNLAAGSSSGGIGMKHKGRIGPAALVGIGTAIIPLDPDDPDQTSVAAVTSGTGEHMATTTASAKCAERLWTSTRRGRGGRSIDEPDEQQLMEAFILDDFMNHPGVRNQPSTGAIGVMAVKKDRTGVYFYFAHNTDSFALASMATTERAPLCVMSRLGKVRSVAQGGRKIRLD